MAAASTPRPVHRQHEVRDVDTELVLKPPAAEQPQVARLAHAVSVQDDGPWTGPVAMAQQIGVRLPVGLAVGPALRARQVDRRLVLADERQVLEVDARTATAGDPHVPRRTGSGWTSRGSSMAPIARSAATAAWRRRRPAR